MNNIAHSFKVKIYGLQEYSLMLVDIFKGLSKFWRTWSDAVNEMYWIGARAFLPVLLGGIFVGIILALETGHQLDHFGAKTLVGRTVSLGMIRELGPVITGLLLAARTGAKNASELGAMQISEQIDALRAFGTSPVEKLVIPRTIAAVVMFLPLTAIADMSGILSGMIVTKLSLNVDTSFFWHSALSALLMKDIFVGFIKPFFFAFFISTISCYYGFSTRGGTVALGKTVINAVVVSSLIVLVLDFIFTKVVWELL
ncbi:MAG TPA: ABC transporter permease [Ignavibacteriaceae bacterium]|nr:ABC transporter permease [Ignavibacteriaceae bacterium]